MLPLLLMHFGTSRKHYIHCTQKQCSRLDTAFNTRFEATGCIKFTKRVELWIDFWQLDNIFESPGQNNYSIVWKTDSELPIGPHSYTTLDRLWEKTRPFCSLGGSLTFFHPYFLTKVYVLIPSTKYLFLLIKFAYSWSLFTSVTLACTAWLDDIYSSRQQFVRWKTSCSRSFLN